MPKRGQQHPISEEERLMYIAKLEALQAADPTMTRERFATEVGLKRSTMSDILNGKVKQSTRKAKIEEKLGISPPLPRDKVLQRIAATAIRLEPVRRERLLERALALLDEQDSKSE